MIQFLYPGNKLKEAEMQVWRQPCIWIFPLLMITCAKITTSDDVIDRYVKAIGGRSAFDQVEIFIGKATYSYPETGNQFHATFYWKRPNLIRAKIKINEPISDTLFIKSK